MSVSIEAARALGRGDYDKVISLCEKKLEKSPNHLASLNMLARCFQRNGQIEVAVVYAEKSLLLDKTNINNLVLLAQNHLDKKNYEKAYECCCKITEVGAEPTDIPFFIRMVLFVMNMFSRTKEFKAKVYQDIDRINAKENSNLIWAKEFKHWYESNQDAIIAHGKTMDEKP